METEVADTLNVFDNTETRTPIVICLEGNGIRPSHRGGGYSEEGAMFTLNTIEKHAVCYEAPIADRGGCWVMSERQMSMMCTHEICNSLVSTDHKGPQVICYAVDSHPQDSRFKLEGGHRQHCQ